jgi:hypothetical protein
MVTVVAVDKTAARTKGWPRGIAPSILPVACGGRRARIEASPRPPHHFAPIRAPRKEAS